MQPSKPVRASLTIVGIVSNVVAITMVSMVLYSESVPRYPGIQEVAESIKAVAKTKKVTAQDVIEIMKRPHSFLSSDIDGWVVAWEYGNAISDVKLEFHIIMYAKNPHGEEGYLIVLLTEHTYNRGLKHLYENVARAFSKGALFPLSPYSDIDMEQLALTNPK